MFLFTFVDEKKNQRGTRRILGIYSKPRKSWPVHCTKWKKGQKPFQVKESRYCSWLSNLMKETCRCDPCWCDMPDDGLSEWRSGGEVRKGKNNKKKVKSVFHIHRGCHIGFTEFLIKFLPDYKCLKNLNILITPYLNVDHFSVWLMTSVPANVWQKFPHSGIKQTISGLLRALEV